MDGHEQTGPERGREWRGGGEERKEYKKKETERRREKHIVN
jgi:hypothetical protein